MGHLQQHLTAPAWTLCSVQITCYLLETGGQLGAHDGLCCTLNITHFTTF